jgi:hypothetical protein
LAPASAVLVAQQRVAVAQEVEGGAVARIDEGGGAGRVVEAACRQLGDDRLAV